MKLELREVKKKSTPRIQSLTPIHSTTSLAGNGDCFYNVLHIKSDSSDLEYPDLNKNELAVCSNKRTSNKVEKWPRHEENMSWSPGSGPSYLPLQNIFSLSLFFHLQNMGNCTYVCIFVSSYTK